MNGLHTNGAGPFFRNLFPIRVHTIHILLLAVLDCRSRTAQARVAIYYIYRSRAVLLAGGWWQDQGHRCVLRPSWLRPGCGPRTAGERPRLLIMLPIRWQPGRAPTPTHIWREQKELNINVLPGLLVRSHHPPHNGVRVWRTSIQGNLWVSLIEMYYRGVNIMESNRASSHKEWQGHSILE